MRAREPRIVDILRDFLDVHLRIREIVAEHRAGTLRFQHVTRLVSDDESSSLFRLKERCHAIYRDPSNASRRPGHREALFDLAVGSLFHEAMKLREDLYQSESYGPRVRALRDGAGEESKALFDEFERMLDGVGTRLEEGVHEVETVVRRSADQLRILLAECGDDGTAARFLTEREADAEVVFGLPLFALLEEMHGSAAVGLERAGRSYLASGYFDRAAQCFAHASHQDGVDPAVEALHDYALGMQAYLARDYTGTLERLSRWAEHAAAHAPLVPLARDAVSRVGQLAEEPQREAIARGAARLLERLAEAVPEPAADTRR